MKRCSCTQACGVPALCIVMDTVCQRCTTKTDSFGGLNPKTPPLNTPRESIVVPTTLTRNSSVVQLWHRVETKTRLLELSLRTCLSCGIILLAPHIVHVLLDSHDHTNPDRQAPCNWTICVTCLYSPYFMNSVTIRIGFFFVQTPYSFTRLSWFSFLKQNKYLLISRHYRAGPFLTWIQKQSSGSMDLKFSSVLWKTWLCHNYTLTQSPWHELKDGNVRRSQHLSVQNLLMIFSFSEDA